MSSLKRAAAICAAAASVALAAAPPAAAQDPLDHPCTVSLPECTNYAFDTARGGVELGRNAWHDVTSHAISEACGAYEFVTGEPCPVHDVIRQIFPPIGP